MALQQTETVVPRQIGGFIDIGTSKSQEKTTFARYSPDGQELLTGSCDKTLKVVDINILRWNQRQTGERPSFRKTYQGHRGYVSDGVKSPSHALYVSAASDGELRFFNSETNEAEALTHSETLGSPINSIDFISSSQLACAVRDLDKALIFDLKRNCNYQIL